MMTATVSTTLSDEILTGDAIYIAAAAKLFPRHRQDRPVSPSTVFRWICEGVKLPGGERVHLEGMRLAGRWLTSRAAIKRFIERQQVQTSEAPPMRTPTRRERDHAAAAAALASKYGIE